MLFLIGCTKKDSPPPIVPDVVENFSVVTITVNGVSSAGTFYGVSSQPQIRVSFSAPVKRSTATSILLNAANGEVLLIIWFIRTVTALYCCSLQHPGPDYTI
jgi:hypothetical protein